MGAEIVSQALELIKELTINEVYNSLTNAKVQDGTITAMFERRGQGVLMFSIKQHIYFETQSVNIVMNQKSHLIFFCAELRVSYRWQGYETHGNHGRSRISTTNEDRPSSLQNSVE